MAERMVRQLFDDLDGTEIGDGRGERVVFTLRGSTYQLDLSPSNVAKFDRALKPFIEAAQKIRRVNGQADAEKPLTRKVTPRTAAKPRGKAGRKRKATTRTGTKDKSVRSVTGLARMVMKCRRADVSAQRSSRRSKPLSNRPPRVLK
jgi:Lsr2